MLMLLVGGTTQAKPVSKEIFTRAMELQADVQRGKTEFVSRCSACHGEDAWGSYDGEFPQLAGQHARVIIKQLSDIFTGIRNNPRMSPVVTDLSREEPQLIADIAAYLENLPMNPSPEEGFAENLGDAESIYKQKCISCHGTRGEGDGEKLYPLVQGQHYEYLLRQLSMIRDGKRGNAHPLMIDQIQGMSDDELALMADYLSRFLPPADRLADE